MKTGFYMTPREWQEWAAANIHRAPDGLPLADVAPGDYIVITDGAEVEWRMDIVAEDEHEFAHRGPLLPGPLGSTILHTKD